LWKSLSSVKGRRVELGDSPGGNCCAASADGDTKRIERPLSLKAVLPTTRTKDCQGLGLSNTCPQAVGELGAVVVHGQVSDNPKPLQSFSNKRS
jgi:hypothetical protein